MLKFIMAMRLSNHQALLWSPWRYCVVLQVVQNPHRLLISSESYS